MISLLVSLSLQVKVSQVCMYIMRDHGVNYFSDYTLTSCPYYTYSFPQMSMLPFALALAALVLAFVGMVRSAETASAREQPLASLALVSAI